MKEVNNDEEEKTTRDSECKEKNMMNATTAGYKVSLLHRILMDTEKPSSTAEKNTVTLGYSSCTKTPTDTTNGLQETVT